MAEPTTPQNDNQVTPQAGAAQPPAQGTNGLAIASLITGLLGLNVLAIIFGFIALSQIKKNGQGGRGMAIAGIIIGFATLIIGIIIMVWVFVFLGAVTGQVIRTAPDANNLDQFFNSVNSLDSIKNLTPQ